MFKETKRKGFNFFRSYFDVYNELEKMEDKVAFIDALLDRQFLGVKPTGLTGMAKFAWISQVNSIDSQVKGYEDKTRTKIGGTHPPMARGSSTPTEGGSDTPTLQVQEKEKEKEKYIYSENLFLHDWSKCRTHFLNKPTNIIKLDFRASNEFKRVLGIYTPKQIKTALKGLFKQENKNIGSMYLKPNHFLENVDKYLEAETSKSYTLYGKQEKQKKGLGI